ncbi:MAG: M3 family oligoendopeptidase [Flavobacteriales bacterium]|nr:M3 family oligoendopeptidase [Flavobacteriales bacterium]MCB9191003.1 M3 family oligoendopeptidase [Flavobacteriales bacterium]MCB9204762.1 M3 family oligoendopeptidase [Flavobacteriales bacterium]
MEKEAVIPTRSARKYLSEDFKVESWNALEPILNELLERNIGNAEELENWIADLSEVEAVLSEETAWRYIRMNIDTTNKEYESAFNFMVTEIDPKAAPFSDKFNRKLLDSPFLKDLDLDKYRIFLRALEMQIKLYREESIPLFTSLQQLQQKYGAITGSMSVEHNGKTLTLQMANSLLKETDRELRKAIYEKVNAARLSKKDELNQLFTELIALRDKIAKQADYKNYRDYKLDALGRFDYSAEDCFTFHKAIQAECVPLVNKVDEERKSLLGVDALKPYDGDVDPTGKAGLKPFSSEKELIEKSIEAFRRIRPYYGECLETMDAMGHLDLESRLGKAPGGFNYPLYEIGVPFIFMNSVGSVRDLITMVHEGGHAVHSFLSKDLEITAFKNLPSEVAELASMSMELLSIDQWDVFFDNEDDLRRAKKEHLAKIIAVLPWTATIDAFQHWLYENPTHSEKERSDNWLRISSELGSNVVDWTGYEDARAYQWQKQLHLFEVPFYYIEYAIAQLGAIAVWRNYRQNPEKALDQYEAALKMGYTATIGEIYAAAGIEFSFTQDYVRELMQFVWDEYSTL